MRNGTFTSRRKFLLFGGLAIAASTFGPTYTFKKARAMPRKSFKKRPPALGSNVPMEAGSKNNSDASVVRRVVRRTFAPIVSFS